MNTPRNDPRSGYIRLWRQIVDNPVWTRLSPAVLKVMIAFLVKANWRAATWYDGSREIEIPRGSFVTSYPKMAEFCGLTPKQVRLAFDHLERLHFAAYTRAAKWTMVTVLNYSTYQDSTADEGTDEGGVGARSGHDQGTKRAPIEEFKELRNKNTVDIGADAPLVLVPPGEKLSSRQKALTPQQEAWFSQWWPSYWRHVAKKEAKEAFRKYVTSEERFQQVMAATEAQTAEMLSRPTEKRPHPATWLRGERWEDETLAPVRPASSGSQYRRLEMPA